MSGRRVLHLAAIAASIALLTGAAAPAAAAPGDLDPAFGSGGVAVTRPAGFGAGLAAYPGGGYVAAGDVTQRDGMSFFALAKVDEQGSLDPSFGGDGVVLTGFAIGDVPADGEARAVVVQPDGKVVAVGEVGPGIGLARYLPSGELDPGFGTRGRVVEDAVGRLDDARDVILLPDGKLLVAGQGNFGFAVARFLPNGPLDTTFGDGGVVNTKISRGSETAYAIARGEGDSFVLAGGIAGLRVVERIAVARYEADGDLDPTFGLGGVVLTKLGDFSVANDAVVDQFGSVLVCGQSHLRSANRSRFGLVRYEPDGDLDPTFSGDGRQVTSWGGPPGSEAYCTGVAVQPDGMIVAGGHIDFFDFAIARYQPNGSLDSGFAGDGKVRTRFDTAQAGGLVLDGSRIVMTGAAQVGARAGFVFVRRLGGENTGSIDGWRRR